MRSVKKWMSFLLTGLLLAASLTSCGGGEPAEIDTALQGEKTLQIVTTIFPEYDWVRSILGERMNDAEVTMLLDSGVDLHSYQPTADDLVKVANCDLFIYVGGESDEWVEDALSAAGVPDRVVINLLDVLGDAVKEEEVVEGMEEEEEEDGEEEIEYDEHVWLSLKNAAVLCQYIADRLGEIDPDGRDVYSANAAAYIAELNALDEEYQTAVDLAPLDTILFGDRFPFRYLADDYGLRYYAAFAGCSAETEASFETIVFLAEKVDELGLPAVLKIDGSDGKIAQTIIDSTEHKSAAILEMNSMQSTTSADVENGADYLTVMTDNLDTLKVALQ